MQSLDAIALQDIYTGLIKSVVFAIGDHGGRLPGRLCHRRGRRGGWTFDDFRRGDFDFSGCGGGLVFTTLFYLIEPSAVRWAG